MKTAISRLRGCCARSCIGAVPLIACLAACLLTAPVAVAQTAPAYFTIAVFSDAHIDDTSGNPVAANWKAWATTKAWILNNRDAWNIRGLLGTGDYVADPATGATSDWAGFANDLNDIVAAGIPVVAVPGNHDVYSAHYALWDSYFASVMAGWPLAAQYAATYPAIPSYHPLSVNQYQRLDIATSAGVVKLGIGGLVWSPSRNDAARLKGYMDADADRDFVVGTHIFLAPIAGTDASHPCVYNEMYCITSNYAPYGFLDGAGFWDALKDNAGLRAILTGHSHSAYSAQMTGTNGNLVQALSTWNISYAGWGNIILMKFRTDNQTIEFYSWKTAQNVADQGVWGAPKVVSWTPRSDITAPTVSMTAPTDGATVSGIVPVSATATDNMAVVGVQFLVDGAAVGAEATTQPYSMSWDSTTAASGPHSLSARARDAAGNQTTSAAVTVTIDNTAPTVSMSAPANGAMVSGTVPVSADASDNIAVVGVQFLLDGAALSTEDTTGPFSISWDTGTAGTGAHTLSARARDAAGNMTTSATVSVTIDNTAPTISMTAPANGAAVSKTLSLSATASDNTGVAGVQFLLDGAAVGAEDTTAPYAISWDSTTAGSGSHTLSARARDAAGNVTTSATISVTIDNTAPTISMTAPANGTTVSGTVPVSATATDDAGVAGVQFLLDGVALGAEDTTAPYSMSWDSTTAGSGAHTLSARARDAAGNLTTSAAVSVTVDTMAPTVSITAPANGATVSGTVGVSATASDDVGVVGVQFLLDGVALGPEDTTAPYSISWDSTTAGGGTHTLSARARDVAGNLTTSAAVSVTIDITAPTVSITAPANGAAVSGTVAVSATASDNVGVVGVQFLLDGMPLGTEDRTAPYSVSWNAHSASPGPHTLAARARDAAGNQTTSAAITVTVAKKK